MTGNDVVMVIDTSKCIGCKACQVACQQWHSLPAEDTTFTGSYTNPPDMSGANLTIAKFTEVEVGGKLKWLFFKDQCRHCDNPQCKPACPKGAISKHPLGVVRINPNLCIPSGSGACTSQPDTALRLCQLACPYKVGGDGIGIPRWQYTMGGVPQLSKMMKCDFCYNRIIEVEDGAFTDLNAPPFTTPTSGARASTVPSCVVTCPAGAIKINRVDAMRPTVMARLAYLKANGHPNAVVYPYQWPGALTHVNWILTEHPNTYGITF